MSIEGALLSRLKTHAGLSSLVATRVYALRLPQNPVLPAVTFGRIAAERFHAMSADAEPTAAVFQVSAWASSYDAARNVAVQINAALDRWAGTADGTTVTDSLRVGSDIDLWEPLTKIYQVPIDFRIFFGE